MESDLFWLFFWIATAGLYANFFKAVFFDGRL